MIAALTQFFPLACDGCFKGFPAWVGLFLLVVSLIGSIWVLLWSNLGARLAYLVVMVSLSAFMMILSLLWMIGGPGTTTMTGPRGREVSWVPFLPNSEFANDFRAEIESFPSGGGWEPIGTVFPGNVDTNGEFEVVRNDVATALADLAVVQGLEATEPSDWLFYDQQKGPLTPDERDKAAAATVKFNQAASTKLIAGIQIPATDKHRGMTVFVYRDKGLVFLPSLLFLIVSVLGFVLHTWLLARYEEEERQREEQMGEAPEPAMA
ncbi:MAG: hypothetical protein ACLGH3_09505 [Actinomycetota bacterium]